MKSSTFWDITPYSLMKVNRRFGGKYSLHFQSRKVSQIVNHDKAGRNASRAAAEFHRTIRRHILDNITLHMHSCENLKSKISDSLWSSGLRCNAY
jgi:hypothetical protein